MCYEKKCDLRTFGLKCCQPHKTVMYQDKKNRQMKRKKEQQQQTIQNKLISN